MKKLALHEIPRLKPEEYKKLPKLPLVIVLDNIRSHHNIGSVFRTCDAFACEAIFLTGISGTPPHREINKTALGATETVNWKYFEKTTDSILYLKNNNYKVLALEIASESVNITDYKIPTGQKTALVLGHEVYGVDQEVIDLCDVCLEIPQYGTKHSLNVSVSAGIAIWELTKKIQ